MNTREQQHASIVRTEQGLSIVGTRVTLYHIMDCSKAEWPPKLIQDSFDLTEQQVADALEYINTHRESVEAEYQAMLRQADEIRAYWEERNRERLEKIAMLPPILGKEALIDRLKTWKETLRNAA